MNPQPIQVHSAGLSLGDIYYVLFRHKWKILGCCAIGAVGAFAFMRLQPAPYQSEARLFVRYVLADKGVGPGFSGDGAKSPDRDGETIMNSEMEILTSVDLARDVADAVGPEKILAKAGGGKDPSAAMAVVRRNLTVLVPPATSVMHVIFKHPDPEVVQPVLQEVVTRYLKRHVETHMANGMVGDFLTQETDQLRSQLTQTEEELRKAMNKAGVLSVDDAKKSFADQITLLRRELFEAEADLAQRTATLAEVSKTLPSAPVNDTTAGDPVPVEILDEYRSVSNQLDLLQKMEQEVLTQFTPQSPRALEVHAQVTAADETRKKLIAKYPRLTQLGAERAPSVDSVNAATLATQIAALKAKTTVLKSQIEALRAEATKLEQMEGAIVELKRRKELQEATYRNFSASLEQARINDTLGNGRVPNIIEIQKPSPPYSDHSKTNKTAGIILFAGIAVGFAWAFSIEMYFDRSLKRPIDIERNLPAPLLISIPKLKQNLLAIGSGDGKDGANGHNAPDGTHPLVPYHETLRDRLIGYFESINLNHKPKLVAVTGLAHHSGVTTTAAGLARSLSETGEGNVLLVDMNVGQGAAQQFTKGKAVCGLDEMLDDARASANVEPNLYVVAERSPSDQLSRNMPQRFTKLVPKLKASDFDYIIFDMPPVSQISITPRLASFMDMVLLVIESEKNDRDLVQRATRLLAESRAHVGVVLNKMNNYVPARLHQETLAN